MSSRIELLKKFFIGISLAMVMITGAVGGFCINLGHELGHKNTPLERWLAKIVLAPTFYGHFYTEHNRGHHRDVATPADPASSRMGESNNHPPAKPGVFKIVSHSKRLNGVAYAAPTLCATSTVAPYLHSPSCSSRSSSCS